MSNWNDSYKNGQGGQMITPNTNNDAYNQGVADAWNKRQQQIRQEGEAQRAAQEKEKRRVDELFKPRELYGNAKSAGATYAPLIVSQKPSDSEKYNSVVAFVIGFLMGFAYLLYQYHLMGELTFDSSIWGAVFVGFIVGTGLALIVSFFVPFLIVGSVLLIGYLIYMSSG